ncbi:DUF2642 domain-containing protein [Alkalihalobacillus sp. AL-G]|uniref:DUF2642 domain-containing protein n=1 Tax=Alkalihalobacillus sp. AL-G TaxID=2926399 RepID=UPI00272BCA02|nr:DUF2642 domain-containing protein [Alkalihalobacillus sp. AL-G]WLD94714.1 DUF2642 domain-containing protein [Alkalihalobacillus sp. AL-G]
MSAFVKFIGENVELTTSGNIKLSGILIDTGSNIIVLFDGKDFLYIPLVHVHFINFNCDSDSEILKPDEVPIGNQRETISLRNILNNAKGVFTEIFVTSNQSIHGYVTNVMNDYFVFFSPVHKTLYVPLQHLKWLKPYSQSHRPYSLDNEELPLIPTNTPLSRTFEEQCKRNLGKAAVFDLGKDPNKIGKLIKIDNGQIELVLARNQTIYTNLQHVKTVHFPSL